MMVAPQPQQPVHPLRNLLSQLWAPATPPKQGAPAAELPLLTPGVPWSWGD